MVNKSISLEARVPHHLCGERIDKVLAILFTDYSRQRLNHWLKNQAITVDGKHLKSKEKVKGGELVLVNAVLEVSSQMQPEDIPLNIMYEDDLLMVINKEAGRVVHPGAGNHDKTLVNALLFYHEPLQHLPRAGLVHRIDKDTTGLLVIAKTIESYHALIQAMQAHEIHRHYYALVNGIPITGGTVTGNIARDPKNRLKMAVLENGRPAITHYRIKKKFIRHTLLDIELETGRTHQIRLHMASIHHALVGDKTYGGKVLIPKCASTNLIQGLQQFGRQALHAYKLVLPHPHNKKLLVIEAPLPADFKTLLELLEHEQK